MEFSLAALLIHSDSVPTEARDAIRVAHDKPLEDRAEALESAARLLYRDTDLDCDETRDLLGLTRGGCG